MIVHLLVVWQAAIEAQSSVEKVKVDMKLANTKALAETSQQLAAEKMSLSLKVFTPL